MKSILANPPRQLQQIAISQILFDHSEWVTLWGFHYDGDHPVPCDFVIDFELLNKLLRYSGAVGDEVQMQLVSAIERGIEEPSVVDLQVHYGSPVKLDACRLHVSQAMEKTSDGGWRSSAHCLFIDAVHPRFEVLPPAVSTTISRDANLDLCVDVLARCYDLYQGYLELEFDATTAQAMAGLSDDLRYRMAYLAWKDRGNQTLGMGASVD